MQITERYQVSLPDFVGPMDLLVHLVRQRELDVAYISVSTIASDYLDWWIGRYSDKTATNGWHDLDDAGDFIYLTSMLLEYKATTLLPDTETELDIFEDNGSWRLRAEEELLLLQDGIGQLAEREKLHIDRFDRGVVYVAGVDQHLTSDMLANVSLYDIAMAFHNISRELPEEPTHIVKKIVYTIEGQTSFILSFFEQMKRITFDRLAQALHNRIAVVVTFLAMLELMRLGMIAVRQHRPFGRLWIILTDNGDGNG